MRATVRELVTLAACTAILFVGQIALAFLPNIEVVSLLIILYTLTFKKRVLWIIYGFALLEGMLYGFSFWWISGSISTVHPSAICRTGPKPLIRFRRIIVTGIPPFERKLDEKPPPRK